MTCLNAALCRLGRCRELVREVDYTLKTLSLNLLGLHRQDLQPAEALRSFNNGEELLGLMQHVEYDAWLALRLMFHLSGEAS